MKNKENRLKFVLNYLQNKQAYNRDEEEESDVLGMQYAVAAGFDVEGHSNALRKIQAGATKHFGESYGGVSRTHPPLARRLQILETVRRRWLKQRRR